MNDEQSSAGTARGREIEDVFANMGLTDPRVRAQFAPEQVVQAPMASMRVVISSSSDPFNR